MPLCGVPGCYISGVHLFPKDAKLRKKWEKAIRRKNFTATDTSRLCRNHFHESDYVGESIYTGNPQLRRYLKEGTVPSIFPWNSISKTATPRALRRQKRNNNCLGFKTHDEPIMALDEPSTAHDKPSTAYDEPRTAHVETSLVDPLFLGEDIVGLQEMVVTNVESSTGNQQPNVRTTSVSTQTDDCSMGLLSLEAIRMNKDAIYFYTGLKSYEKFMLVLDTLSPKFYNRTYRGHKVVHVKMSDQLLLTLIKLRRNLPDFELGFFFGISEMTVNNIFMTWIYFMYEIWSTIAIWPSKELVQFYMEAFRQDFRATKLIVDTKQFPISKPKNQETQQATSSTFKHKNTLKAEIEATTGGLKSFASECNGGFVSDRQIIGSGDSIMTDKGFSAQNLIVTKDIPVQIINDRKLASKKHIERIIGLAKIYKILKSELSPCYVGLGSQILYVCAMLCNYRENRIK